jgi:hypothetical protein
MPKYTFWRNSIVAEEWTVEAGSEEEALERVQNGEVTGEIVEFIDWASDEYVLDRVEDELVTFINSKEMI